MKFFSQFQADQTNFSEVFKKNKVVHVQKHPVENTDNYFRKLANECGITLIYEEDPVTGSIAINKWTEIKYDAEKSGDSYKSSNKSQPLHTDYGYFSFEIYAAFFYCVSQAKFGGATTFIDVDTIVRVLEEADPKLFERLQNHKIHFGRRENPVAHNDDYILQKDHLGWKINWNYFRAKGDVKHQVLIEAFKNFLDHYIEKSGELTEVKLEPGEGVFFQDRRVLHGRNSFLGKRQLNKGGIAHTIPDEIRQIIAV